MKAQDLFEEEINLDKLSDEIVAAGMQVYEIVKKLIDPKVATKK